ncbi:branched-chain amino acid ABC transporter permease, partial [Salmonella enterica subsp. enterica serovar Java]|nr:branched-chain amino acid ABC transporter permease [Salmonella enterica subsp. enterica serovar Java]
LALQRSRSGRVWRAVSDDPLAAGLFGVDTRRTLALTVITGTAFATIAGAFAATHYGNISFGAGLIYGLKVLIVTAAGSYTSPVGAALGAAAFGLGESLWAGYFPLEWRDGWMLALLVAMLVLRRSGDAFQ